MGAQNAGTGRMCWHKGARGVQARRGNGVQRERPGASTSHMYMEYVIILDYLEQYVCKYASIQ
jgi:hypothetical protein